ncbi:MAG: hypothetical protein RI957_1073 [Verrucomicrobiota bacterium]|jgi:hypothetical protein
MSIMLLRNLTIFSLCFAEVMAESPPERALPPRVESIRVVEDDVSARLQTSIATWEKDGVRVDLIGAIHIADQHYYEILNQTFPQYDSVLFEMVGGDKLGAQAKPAETTTGSEKTGLSGLRDLYATVARFLGLSGQSECIDYSAKNFVHADLSREEFEEKQKQRKESLLGLAWKAGTQGGTATARQPDANRLMAAMLTGNRNMLKLELIHTLGQGDDQVSMFTGDTVIITDRNAKCLQVMEEEISKGRKKLGIFYGSAHFPDMENTLALRGWKRGEERWLTAWNIGKPSPKNPEQPFGERFPKLDAPATGEWWKRPKATGKNEWWNEVILNVPRDQTVAFALYTSDRGVLKMTAQLVPLLPHESREARLEIQQSDGSWKEIARSPVIEPGWSAHFRIEGWDGTKNVGYRVRHGEQSMCEGSVRKDPREKPVIVVASLSCNSNHNRSPRADMIANLRQQDPDLLFFAGDQSYDHEQHTAAWLLWGKQFREITKDRPTVTIPDDHDIGQGNFWGEGGIVAKTAAGHDGGYFFPASYVKMVERCQTWHLPDAFDPSPIAQGIGVYFTNLRVGGVDFAIIEDRKFKSGPSGKIPQMGPRPDHINDPKYDRRSVDLPRLQLLGDRQIAFLRQWSGDWADAQMKCVLSQTAFCGAVHLHGNINNRLLADLDSNAWPQSGRNAALEELRRCRAVHLCGDQHLGVVVQHGIQAHRDGPYGFTSPAIYNNYYGRWWNPENQRAGANPVPKSPLPWTGDYEDGLGNPITMLAYANPGTMGGAENHDNQRGDGYGVARFDKQASTITFEAWPYEGRISNGLKPYPGWPITIAMTDNDGRKPVRQIPVPQVIRDMKEPVISLVDDATGLAVYTQRFHKVPDHLPVYHEGNFSLRFGKNRATERAP